MCIRDSFAEPKSYTHQVEQLGKLVIYSAGMNKRNEERVNAQLGFKPGVAKVGNHALKGWTRMNLSCYLTRFSKIIKKIRNSYFELNLGTNIRESMCITSKNISSSVPIIVPTQVA